MNAFLNWLFPSASTPVAAPPEAKTSAAGALIALHLQGQPIWTPRNYEALAKEGFLRNPIAYRAVRMIAEAIGSLPWLLYEGDAELDTHPLLDLMGRPNPAQSGAELFEAFHAHLQVAGNAYMEVVETDGTPRELYVLRPDRMKVVLGSDGWPEAYEYSVHGSAIRYRQGEAPDASPILHLRLFHPLDDHYGMSPLEAAAAAIDIHNAGGAWNKALLDNAARPSGALVYKGPDGAPNLGAEQFERLKNELENQYRGPANAGRPLLLEGGLSWTTLSLSPHDMDFIDARHVAAREIALAFGVPPMLLGIPGDNTYANFKEANLAFWRQTVLPHARRTLNALNTWLAPRFGAGLRLDVDLDQVTALAVERESLWARVSAAPFLTDDERRAAVGYEPRAESAVGSDHDQTES